MALSLDYLPPQRAYSPNCCARIHHFPELTSKFRSHSFLGLVVHLSLGRLVSSDVLQVSGSNIQTFTDSVTNDVFIFIRNAPVSKSYMVIINIGHSRRFTTIPNLGNYISTSSRNVRVELKTGNVNQYQVGQMIPLSQSVQISDGQGLVLGYY